MHILTLLLALAGLAGIAPRKLVADKKQSSMTYAMHHPMHDWEGINRSITAVLVIDDATRQPQQVAVVVPVAGFDSRNQNRDSHMVEVLDAIRYPNVTFASQDIKTNPDGSLTASGKLTFHNVTRPVTIQAARRDVNGQWQLEGTFSVNLSDYGIERPTLLGLPTDDQFRLSFSLLFH